MPKPQYKKPKQFHKRKFDLFGFLTVFLCITLAFMLICAGAGVAMLKNLMQDEPVLDVTELYSQESTRIFDSENNQIADIGNAIRENVKYNQMPESLIDAFLAVEDSRYFSHNGFDISRFAKAALANVKSGSTSQGGSTFTMQLVKLTYFYDDQKGATRERDIAYKVQQIDLAIQLEKQSTKKEIFELYLNKMNFGGTGNIRGVQKASQYYFNKSVSQLSLPESALLAGIINSPYYYDPYNYLDYATGRRNVVLQLMLRHGYINEEEYDLAKSVKVEDLLYDHRQDASEGIDPNQAYIDEVLLEAKEITGQDPYTISMDIHTAMNASLQRLSFDICAGNTEVQYPAEQFQVGFVTENNQTGEVVAIGGGRNYANGGSSLLNHGTQVFHDPGSTVKPYLSYALAFEHLGWATSMSVTDKPVGDNTWIYSNATGRYDGDVTLEWAYQLSLNTPALEAMYEEIDKLGKDKIIEYMDKLQFSHLDDSQFNVGWAIGANGWTASPMENAAAHSMLMNQGEYIKPHTIKEIHFRSGLQDSIVVAEKDAYKPVKVLSPAAAYLTATMMNKVVNAPFNNFAGVVRRNYMTYAKTGTSDWGDSGVQYGIPVGASKDHWMVVSTSEYTTAVWTGFDKADPNVQSYISSSWLNLNTTGVVNSLILDELYKDRTPEPLAQPEGVTSITHIKGLFPLTSPIENMDSQYITTGLVKSDFAKLESPQESEKVDDIASFKANLADDGTTLHLEWGPYSNADKLSVAPDTKDISLKVGNSVLVAATGRRMFDYSWVYGPIRYKARISQNGNVVDTIVSDTENTTRTVELEGNTETEVCGYYAYENESGGISPHESCITFTTPAKKQTLPLTGTLESIKQWFNSLSLNLPKILEEHSNGEKPVGSVSATLNGKDVTGTPLSQSDLSHLVITIVVD